MDIRHNKKHIPVDLKQNVKNNDRREKTDDSTSEILQNMWDEQKIKNSSVKSFARNMFASKNIFVFVVVFIVMLILIAVIVPQMETEQDNTVSPVSEGEQANTKYYDDFPFDTYAFYGISTVQGELYFARITDIADVGYYLTDVFYEKRDEGNAQNDERNGAVAQSDSQNKKKPIRLVKFGTESYSPDDVLIIPSAQIVNIFPLQDDSPILKAINAYNDSSSL